MNPFGSFKSLYHNLLHPLPCLLYIPWSFYLASYHTEATPALGDIIYYATWLALHLSSAVHFEVFILPLRNSITEPCNHSRTSESLRDLGKMKRFESGGLSRYSSKEMLAGACSASPGTAL